MPTPAQSKKLGALILLILLGLAGLVAALAVDRLRDDKERYFVRFHESVSGLEVGTSVKIMGVRVGQVERVGIGDDVESVIVTLALEPGTPIKTDTRAILNTVGVTGLKFVELVGGSVRTAQIEPNSRSSIIKAGASTLRQLMARSRSISIKMDALNHNVSELLSGETRALAGRLEASGDQLAVTASQLRSGNRKRLHKIFRQVDRTTARAERAAQAVEKLRADNVGRFKSTLRAAQDAVKTLDQIQHGYDTRRAERAVTAVVAATRRRADTGAKVERAAKAMEAAAAQLGKVGEELSTALDRRSRQWRGIKKKLRRAGLHLSELGRRFGQ
jgi:ABC-type transporter Mla subunit MlaD